MKVPLLYYVILSVDTYGDDPFNPITKIDQATPDICKSEPWVRTEAGVDDFSKHCDIHIGHRKYVATLTPEQMIELIDEAYLSYECETAGSLTEYGHLEALSFDGGEFSQGYTVNAYISTIMNIEGVNDDIETMTADELQAERTRLMKLLSQPDKVEQPMTDHIEFMKTWDYYIPDDQHERVGYIEIK